jgi:predicted dehydrogenase
MSQLRIGLLGAAGITPRAVIEPASVMPAVDLTAVAARDHQRASAFAQQHGIATVCDSYDALINHPDIDLIYNPLPASEHALWCIRALHAGKHVLCEKPFAMNSEEASAILSAAKSSGKRVIEAFHYRYHPAFKTCMHWVRSGSIGQITDVQAVLDVHIPYDENEIRHRQDTGGGAMMDLGCYPVSWALMLIDAELVDVSAEATISQGGVDESMRGELTFADNTVARLSCTMHTDTQFKAELTVTGSEGEIVFRNPLAPQHGAALTLSTRARSETAAINPISTYTWQLAALVNALESGEPLPTEGEAILRQQDTLDRLYAAAGLRDLRFRS